MSVYVKKSLLTIHSGMKQKQNREERNIHTVKKLVK